MIALLLALLLAPGAALPPHVISVEQVDPGQELAGADFLLIAEAARHPRMRRANFFCYRIFVHDVRGMRRVSFIDARNRVVERQTPDGTEIVHLPVDPNCRSISFEMNGAGHVSRVIFSRH